MNIWISDPQSVLSKGQKQNFRNRLFYSLLRFGHRINNASMQYSFDPTSNRFRCGISVNVEGSGIVSVKRACVSPDAALNLAVDAVEPKVACRVDWRAWFNFDTFATWAVSFERSLSGLLGLREERDGAPKATLLPAPDGRRRPNLAPDFSRPRQLRA